MSHRDVYYDEMTRQQFSDSDVERILSGQEPENETLAQLAPALVALHSEQPETPSEETISRFAAEAAEIARSSAPAEGNTASPKPGFRYRGFPGSLRRKLATLAAALLTFAGMTGIAFAADGAAPGDPLYGLDRALEQIGINDGAAAERIAEARTLTMNGQVPAAFHHLADSVETEDQDSVELHQAADALRTAANNVRSESDDAESQKVRSEVAAMLEQMAEMSEGPDFDGAIFGQRLAEMARAIPGGENPVGTADGPPEDTGPPEDGGGSSSGGDGTPADSDPPEDAGPPTGTGGRP